MSSRGDGSVCVWDKNGSSYDSVKILSPTGLPEPSYSCDLARGAGHGNVVATRGSDIFIYRETTRFGGDGEWLVDNVVEDAHDGEVNKVLWRKGGDGFITVGDDGYVKIWGYEIG